MAMHQPFDSSPPEPPRELDRGREARDAGIDEAMIDRLVRTFYGRIRQDVVLGPIFETAIGADWEPHLLKLVDFWSAVTLASGRYHGRPIPAHARLPTLAPEHFPRWLDLFRRTAAEVCPPEASRLFVDRAERIAASMMMALSTVRGPDWHPPADLIQRA